MLGQGKGNLVFFYTLWVYTDGGTVVTTLTKKPESGETPEIQGHVRKGTLGRLSWDEWRKPVEAEFSANWATEAMWCQGGGCFSSARCTLIFSPARCEVVRESKCNKNTCHCTPKQNGFLWLFAGHACSTSNNCIQFGSSNHPVFKAWKLGKSIVQTRVSQAAQW